MRCRISELLRLELIDLRTGAKLGCPDDIAIDTATGEIAAFILYGKERVFGLFGRHPDRELPFSGVRLIGTHTILIDPGTDDADSFSPYR